MYCFLSYFICFTGLFGVGTACVFVFHVRYVKSEFFEFHSENDDLLSLSYKILVTLKQW